MERVVGNHGRVEIREKGWSRTSASMGTGDDSSWMQKAFDGLQRQRSLDRDGHLETFWVRDYHQLRSWKLVGRLTRYQPSRWTRHSDYTTKHDHFRNDHNHRSSSSPCSSIQHHTLIKSRQIIDSPQIEIDQNQAIESNLAKQREA
jgi:hypothetical protein